MKFLPQLIILFWVILGLGVAIEGHGKPRKPFNFIDTFISWLLFLALLYWGGFFDGLIATIKQ